MGPSPVAPPRSTCGQRSPPPEKGRVDGIKATSAAQIGGGGGRNKITSSSWVVFRVRMDNTDIYIGKQSEGVRLLEGIHLKWSGLKDEKKIFPVSFSL